MNVKPLFLHPGRLFYIGILLVVLALLDSLFTDYGIRHQYIHEANPIVRYVYESSVFGFYALKISLPLVLLVILLKIEPKLWLCILMKMTLVLYGSVLCVHLFWLSLVL